jgi:hypothetical protein
MSHLQGRGLRALGEETAPLRTIAMLLRKS